MGLGFQHGLGELTRTIGDGLLECGFMHNTQFNRRQIRDQPECYSYIYKVI